MIVKPHIDHPELATTLKWYTDNFDSVHLISCGKGRKGCGKVVAIEVAGGHGLALDQRGVAVIPIGDDLLAWRVRLDEHDAGPMVGYQCKCGNDTRLSKAEEHHPPVNGWFNQLMPHEAVQIAQDIKRCGKHKPDYQRQDNLIMYETFKAEQVK